MRDANSLQSLYRSYTMQPLIRNIYGEDSLEASRNLANELELTLSFKLYRYDQTASVRVGAAWNKLNRFVQENDNQGQFGTMVMNSAAHWDVLVPGGTKIFRVVVS